MLKAQFQLFAEYNQWQNQQVYGAAAELSEEQYDRMFNLNTKSVYWGVRHVVPVMQANGGGAIVNTASIGAKSPRPKGTAYNAAKGAVVVMTRGLAGELARFKIRVNCVCPLAAETGFFKSVIAGCQRRR